MLLLIKVSEELKESANINKVRENRKDTLEVNNCQYIQVARLPN